MKTNQSPVPGAFWLNLVLLCGFVASARAGQYGFFTYRVIGGSWVEITDYTNNDTGPVVIPDEIDDMPVTGIDEYAFSGHTGLTVVTIPESVEVIRWGAFSGCTGLTAVTIPSSVECIEDYAFAFCTGLHAINVAQGNHDYYSAGGVLFTAWATLLQYPGGKAGVYDVPAGVVAISRYAFSDCAALTGITVPASVSSIPSSTFTGCHGLESITVAPGNPQYVSPGGVLFNAEQTTLLRCPARKAGAYAIPSTVTRLGYFAFNGCTILTGVTIPSSVTSIGAEAFYGCRSLTGVTIPASLTSIGDGAFWSCTGLTSLTLHEGLTFIGSSMFEHCTGLTRVSIPSSVTSIRGCAFDDCPGLTTITVPAGVVTIGESAFCSCPGLTSAVFLGHAPTFAGSDTFANHGLGFTIYYLSGKTGFASPTWHGYPAQMIDVATRPAGAWLLEHGYGYDISLHQDPDGDGVPLLMAYALDLDPTLNLRSRLPHPLLNGSTLSLNFHAASSGITYRVETSTSLQNWTTNGVTQSPPGADGRSTASVIRDGPQRFLRLVVED